MDGQKREQKFKNFITILTGTIICFGNTLWLGRSYLLDHNLYLSCQDQSSSTHVSPLLKKSHTVNQSSDCHFFAGKVILNLLFNVQNHKQSSTPTLKWHETVAWYLIISPISSKYTSSWYHWSMKKIYMLPVYSQVS